MTGEALPIDIDEALCNGCGLCAEVCPVPTLGIVNGKAAIIADRCLECAHCEAICPVGAVTVSSLDRDVMRLRTLDVPAAWIPYGEGNAAGLVQLMRSRRSCRKFSDKPVSRDLLADLVKIGKSAPSGTNSQRWTFTILPDRHATSTLGRAIGTFFGRLNRLAANPFLRNGLALLGRKDLARYYRGYYPIISRTLKDWEERGIDRLFHGAPATIVIGARPGGSTPDHDAHLATQNILLAAHAMGLGTCLIGFATAAMGRDAAIQETIGIPADEKIHSVIALGYSEREFIRCAGRKAAPVRWFTGE